MEESINQYFNSFKDRNKASLKKFYARLPYFPALKNKIVLDFACGTGELAESLVLKNAKKVIGIEKNKDLVKFCQNRFQNISHDQLEFIDMDISYFESDSIDIIFCKDSFEHFIDPIHILDNFYRILRPGGEAVLSIGPLWCSVFGDHQLLKNSLGFSLPWLHVALGEGLVTRLFNNSSLTEKKYFQVKKIEDIRDYLNLWNSTMFEEMFEKSPFEIISINKNVHENGFVNFVGQLNVPKNLEKYWVRNLYVYLRKPI